MRLTFTASELILNTARESYMFFLILFYSFFFFCRLIEMMTIIQPQQYVLVLRYVHATLANSSEMLITRFFFLYSNLNESIVSCNVTITLTKLIRSRFTLERGFPAAKEKIDNRKTKEIQSSDRGAADSYNVFL